jgi:hypothetical protein
MAELSAFTPGTRVRVENDVLFGFNGKTGTVHGLREALKPGMLPSVIVILDEPDAQYIAKNAAACETYRDEYGVDEKLIDRTESFRHYSLSII